MLKPIETGAYKIEEVDTFFIKTTPLILSGSFVWDTNSIVTASFGFKLALINHSFLEFPDTESVKISGVHFTKFNYFMGSDKDFGYCLVASHTNAVWDYYLINTTSGKIDTVNNIPKFSSDGKFYISLFGSATGGVSGFIVIKNLQTGFALNLSYNDVMTQFIGWVNNDSFLFLATDRKSIYKKYYQFTIKE